MLPLHCSRVNTVVFCLHDQIRDDHLGVWLFTDTSTTKGGGGEEGAKLTCSPPPPRNRGEYSSIKKKKETPTDGRKFQSI